MRIPFLSIAISLLVLDANGLEANESINRGIAGFDDAAVTCGPGTDACFDSPQGIARLVKRWKKRGLDGVYFRVSETFLPENYIVRWPPETFHPRSNFLFVVPDRIHRSFDVLGTFVNESKRVGLEPWVWYPTIYSCGAPPQGPNFTVSWGYEDRFGHEHPEILTIDRKGNKQYMIWEYAYPEARRAKIAHFVYFAKHSGARKFLAGLRTEAGQMLPPPKHADQFGFNEPVVNEMKRRYGVDILTDARFDYEHAEFDLHDPMLENWRKLRGEYLTQLFRELRVALSEIDPNIEIAVQIPSDRIGSCLGNWTVDWRTWIEEGLVDEIVYRCAVDDYTFENTEHDPADLGYLTSPLTHLDIYNYIKNSSRPSTRLIKAGGRYISVEPKPQDADGWRVDQWSELYSLANFQRWQQWKKDLKDFGHIKFLNTDFDDFPTHDDGYGGGFGEFGYRPDLRKCPGYWTTLGDGSDSMPVVQDKIRRGRRGNAIKLTRKADASGYLVARHDSRSDRSGWAFLTDTAPSTGQCEISFALLLEDQQSGLVVYPMNNGGAPDSIGFYVVPGSGIVQYLDTDNYVATEATIGPGKWYEVSVKLDLDRRVYSAYLKSRKRRIPICKDVAYSSPQNTFNSIGFYPQGSTGSVFYLDDMSWNWIPNMPIKEPGKEVLLKEGFESVRPGDSVSGMESNNGVVWTVRGGTQGNLVVDPSVSHGNEYQSLRFKNEGGTAVASGNYLRLGKTKTFLVDFDLLPRSGKYHQLFAVNHNLESPGETGLSIVGSENGQPLAGVRIIDSMWHCWNGEEYENTNVRAEIDVFSHVQLKLDPTDDTCRVALQTIGESPKPLWEGPLNAVSTYGNPVSVQLESRRGSFPNNGPAFDNLLVTLKEKPDL